jgi:2-hydroxy-3-keto-5-methylthiopentenyl-1-phosphate phosphatase
LILRRTWVLSTKPSMKTAILSDFDGTIVNVDTGEYILSQFAHGDWRAYDEQLDIGKITLQECPKKQFAMVKETEARLVKRVEAVVLFRPGFEDLVEQCEIERIPFVVVSGGLDFVIKHLLRAKNLLNRVDVVAPKANVTKRGITLRFPKASQSASLNLKDDLVMSYEARGIRTVYIGDGSPDFAAIRRADVRFAIRGSKLSELCKRADIAFREIDDFHDVLRNFAH